MKLHVWIVSALFVAAFSAIGFAQTDQGKFSGAVLDSTGASVAGATVMVKNERTGEERTQTTSDGGVFTSPLADGTVRRSAACAHAAAGSASAAASTASVVSVRTPRVT